MKIAVLGGNGYLGHHVTKYFNATPLSRRTGFDITKPKDCEQLKDYDVVIHMAALVDKSDKQRSEVIRVNVKGALNITSVLGDGQTLIFTSTKDVYSEHTAYSNSKLTAELLIKDAGQWNHNNFRTGVFRLSTTYAPPTNGSNFVNHFVKCIQEGKEITLLHQGKQVRDFLYVDDLSRAFEKFIEKKKASGVFDIGGGKFNSLTIIELVRLIEEVVGKAAKIKFSTKKPGGQLQYITDLDRILVELYWLPIVSISKGIRRIING